MIEEAKFSYSRLGKVFEKRTKITEDQGEKYINALEEHRKQLAKYNNEKESLKHSKQKEISEEHANKRMEDTQNLTYSYKG